MSDTRELIYTAIHRRPGIHFSGLVRRLDVAPGQVQYHIRRLQEAKRIASDSCFGRTHYFPPAFNTVDRRAIALLRRETTRSIVALLLEREETHPEHLVESLDIARSTVEYHLGRLEQAGLVEKRIGFRGRVTVVIADSEHLDKLMAVTASPAHHRLADRFERLVDKFVE